jgi:hypothetical protein
MATLTKAEKSQLKMMMREPGWNALLRFAALKTSQWKESAIEGKTAHQELRALHKRDGKVEGVTELLDELERTALE